MQRRLRVDVLEGEELVVFVDLFGTDFTRDDLAKQAGHGGSIRRVRAATRARPRPRRPPSVDLSFLWPASPNHRDARDALQIGARPDESQIGGFGGRGRDALALAEPDLHQQRPVVIQTLARLTHDLADVAQPIVAGE